MFALAVGSIGGGLAGRWAGWNGFTGCCCWGLCGGFGRWGVLGGTLCWIFGGYGFSGNLGTYFYSVKT